MVHHYTDSGLDSIYLDNGFQVEETAYGRSVSIEDSEGLHRAIALWLIRRPSPLNGAELRFLRIEMEMTQRDLAGIIGGLEQTLRLWEKNRGKSIPGAPDRLVRALFAQASGGDGDIRAMLQRLADLDRIGHYDACFKHNRKGWKPSVTPCRARQEGGAVDQESLVLPDPRRKTGVSAEAASERLKRVTMRDEEPLSRQPSQREPPRLDGFAFSIAPMMDWTDRHCRAFHRGLTRRARLYTEMVTAPAILHGDRDRLLGFDAAEHPVGVQLGGSDPADLALAARIAADFGYAEINLNVGCPSDRVQNGAFGACLMRDPGLVGACVAAMKAAVDVPVTVKCRLGVDDQGPEALDHLADAVVAAGADALFVHARKAWLQGLSPRENRDVPPLDYERVFALKRRLPHVPIALNGGLSDWATIEAARPHVDGVMVGRAAYGEPSMLLEVDSRIFGDVAVSRARMEALEAYLPYVEAQLAEGMPLHAMTRHLLGLFNGLPGARGFRRHLSVEGVKRHAGLEVLREAMRLVRPAGEAREAA